MSLIARRSLTFRLTLLFAAVSTAVLLLLGLVVAGLVERHFEELDQDILDGKLALLRHAVAETASSAELRTLPARIDAALVGHHGLEVAIWPAEGEALYATPGADFPDSLRRTAMPDEHRPVRWQSADGRQFRGVSGAATLGLPEPAPLTVTVSTNLVHHEHFMHDFQAALWLVVGLAALVSGLLGWVAARKGLAPLRAISRDAAAITADRLHHRLSSEPVPAELAEVTHTLNAMLARLEDSFQRLSDFSSDLAHELRTPVTNLLTQTQVTLSKTRDVADYQDVLASNSEELERLSRMIADMLYLAKADNDLVVPNLEPVDLRRAVDGLLEFYEAVADENAIQLGVTGHATVAGDRLMLRRAIGNLLANAFQHTPEGGRIDVHIGLDGQHSALLSLSNTGETIPAEHLARLFDRFYRADPSRQRLSDGVGLGLAITRSILRAHGGEAGVESGDGLTTFTLCLPV